MNRLRTLLPRVMIGLRLLVSPVLLADEQSPFEPPLPEPVATVEETPTTPDVPGSVDEAVISDEPVPAVAQVPAAAEVESDERWPMMARWFNPQGTLGTTYIRASHPVPNDKHPRTGMLAVRDRGIIPYLSVNTMGGFRMKNGVWLFESSRPLDPGVCQVVRVDARQSDQDIAPFDSRFVRLIPGRIVYLDYKQPSVSFPD
jgi:hypothetical protein